MPVSKDHIAQPTTPGELDANQLDQVAGGDTKTTTTTQTTTNNKANSAQKSANTVDGFVRS